MPKEQKKSRNLGLWIPLKILKMTFLSGDDKIYYAYIYSFGERGCWATDEQIGKALGRGGRSIQRYKANCRKAGLFKVTGEGTPRRRIWALAHPKYKAWRKKQAEQLRQIRRGSTTDPSRLPRQNRPTTNKGTNKTTIKERGGSPSPAEQAHAPLNDKQQQLEAYRTKEETTTSIEQLTRNFGRGGRRLKLTDAEFEASRQNNRQALLATGNGEKS